MGTPAAELPGRLYTVDRVSGSDVLSAGGRLGIEFAPGAACSLAMADMDALALDAYVHESEGG